MGVNQSWGATSSHRRSGASHTLPSIIRPGLALPSGSGCFRPWEGFPPFPKGPEEPAAEGVGCAGPEAHRRASSASLAGPSPCSHVGGQDPFLRTREKPTGSFVHSWNVGVLGVFRALALVWPLGDKGEQDRQAPCPMEPRRKLTRQ